MTGSSRGPLAGVVVVEVGGIGPGPFAGMILADLGAEVIRVDRPGGSLPFPLRAEHDLANRGKKMVALDLKQPAALQALLALADDAHVLVEGFRPGVAERIGFGPKICLKRNPRLVYGRLTGWGQDGPWAQMAGHDINYISATGALHAIGHNRPEVPLNLLGDYAGGSTYLVIGVLAALLEARTSGQGQVVDAAIVDGVTHLMAMTHSLLNGSLWKDERAANLLDGAAPFYGVYETADGGHLAVGPIEPAFWAELLRVAGLPALDRDDWPRTRARLEEAFRGRTLADWTEAFAGSDACVTPVVSIREAVNHPQLAARRTLREVGGRLTPAPAPRFSRAPDPVVGESAPVGAHTVTVLAEAGLDVGALLASGAAHQAGRGVDSERDSGRHRPCRTRD